MRARNKLYTPKECLKYWDERKPIRGGKLIWASIRKCIERAVKQDEMLEKSHIVLDEFVGKFAGSKVFIDNGNHDKEVRNKTIDEMAKKLKLNWCDYHCGICNCIYKRENDTEYALNWCGYGELESIGEVLQQMKGGAE